MACSSGSSDMSNSDSCFLQLQWDPLLRYFFGLGVVGVPAAADDDHRTFQHELELFSKCMESPGSSEAPEQDNDTTAMPEDQLDELLRNFWDAEEEQQLGGLNSSCILEEKSAAASPFLDDDDLLALCSALPVGPTSRDEPVAGPQPAPSSSSSHCTVAPQAGDDGGARRQTNCSSKRSATQEATDEWSCKRSRNAASSGAGPSVVRPFAVVKPGGDGVDGEATLADINERILSRPTRPVRHPVGKFACAPRALAGGDSRPAPSGKAVAGFTRLHTAGKGTITIIRTSG
uniref:Uncharacterized protein n=1 Tax=Avena sativa TaxID=4498 RepID=A0ACD5ZU40_AVESA